MSQLRIEIRALTEENEFLRSREDRVHEEETRLQMVSEMAKKLGTNVSKFELVNLRNQVRCRCARPASRRTWSAVRSPSRHTSPYPSPHLPTSPESGQMQ